MTLRGQADSCASGPISASFRRAAPWEREGRRARTMHSAVELDETIRLLRQLRAKTAERLLAGEEALRPLHLAVGDLLELLREAPMVRPKLLQAPLRAETRDGLTRLLMARVSPFDRARGRVAAPPEA